MNFGIKARELYKKSRKVLAYILIFAVVILRFVPFRGFQSVTLIALGIILLEMLFEIHKTVTFKVKKKHYDRFYEATTDMKKYLMAHVQKKNKITVRWLGMSMQHAWKFLDDQLIMPWLEDPRKKELFIELAMLDSKWDQIKYFNPSWVSVAESNYATIKDFTQSHKDELDSKNWEINIYRYRHMPNWHGLLIDEKYLFLSVCSWKKGKLLGGENPYEFYKAGDDKRADAKIKQFLSWFNYCREYDVIEFLEDNFKTYNIKYSYGISKNKNISVTIYGDPFPEEVEAGLIAKAKLQGYDIDVIYEEKETKK